MNFMNDNQHKRYCLEINLNDTDNDRPWCIILFSL